MKVDMEVAMTLFEDGWRADNCEELMNHFEISRSKAIALCELLADIEAEYE